MRRRVRVLLDRRVVPAWPRRGGLGLRPHARRPVAQACAGSGTRSVRRGAVLGEPPVAPDLGGRVHVQRRAHHPRLPRWIGAARLPRLRSHRGGRRIHRLDRRHRMPIRLPADPDREPRLGQCAQHGPESGHGRDRRLHRRRRLPRPTLAHLPRGQVPEHVARRGGWTEPRSAGRRTDRRVHRARAGRARSRAPQRLRGGAHPRVQVHWAGRIYGSGLTRALRVRRSRVYHGVWGLAPYQSLYEPAPSLLGSLPQMPEWHLAFAFLMGLSALSFVWSPLTLLLPLLIGAALLPLAQAGLSAAHASFPDAPPRRAARLKRRRLLPAPPLLQPPARLRGRLKESLTPWRCRGASQPAPLSPLTTSTWSEHWQAPDRRLNSIATAVQAEGGCVLRGGEHDRWDLEVRCGFLGAARLLMGVEDHGGGQFVRLRLWPDVPAWGPVLTVGFAALALGAFHDHAWPAAAVLGLMALLPALRTLQQCTAAMATIARGLKRLQDEGA